MKYLFSIIACSVFAVTQAQQDGLSSEPVKDSVEIAACTFGSASSDTLRNGKPKPKSLHERGYVTTDEIGGIFGFSGNSKGRYFFSYHSSNVWQVNRYFYIGPGFGFEIGGKNSIKFDNGNKTNASIMMPIFMELRIVPGEKRIMPMISQKQGYTFYFAGRKPGLVGGVMSQTQLGFKLMINKWASFNMSVGYRLQYIGIPAKYASQFGDLQPMPYQEKPAALSKVYHYGTVHIGFTY